MSELIQGAIIGIVGTIIGAIIAAIVSYRIAKLQFEQQEREYRRNRLLEIRKNYLFPLRETISKWAIKISRMIENVEGIGWGIQWDGRVSELKKKAIEDLRTELKNLTDELEIHRGQISDKKLYDAIDKILSHEAAVNRKKLALMSPTVEWDANETSLERVQIVLDKLKTDSTQLREYLRDVNKRIEDLLSGEPSN